ncbi:hypothetical protein D3C75_997740 [compost metagenome]
MRKQQASGFIGQQQHAGQQQWQYHIDQPVQQQGCRQRCGTELVGKGRQQDRFEHPDAARYVAEHARSQGQQVHQHERAERRGFGQQQVEHGGSRRHIQRGNQQLQGRQACIRQAKCAPPQLNEQVIGRRLLGQASAVQANYQ